MTKDELTAWALKNGWTMMDGHPSLTKPNQPTNAIVRLVMKATLVNVDVKSPAGKWAKISGEAYNKITADEETGFPRGLKLDSINGFSYLMEDNKNRAVFAKFGKT